MSVASKPVSSSGVTPPLHLGKYQLLRRLATGGMAEIFLARSIGIEGFEKVVVLKRILPHLAERPAFIRMFVQEARLAATLHHQNVAQTYDIGKVGSTYFFTMEYIQGVDLRQIIRQAQAKKQRIPLAHTITIVSQTAAGLHYAHAKHSDTGVPLGIVHRDVSPSNVLVGFDGGVKLVDFGIAKATSQPTETAEGTLKGKIAYMSPEQCMGMALDRRSDLFSLGILLYELTTGRHLFGGSEFAIMQAITAGELVLPSRVDSSYPRALERIVLKALAKDRTARYQTAQELQSDLEELAQSQHLPLSALALAGFVRDLCAHPQGQTLPLDPTGAQLHDFSTTAPIGEPVTEADSILVPEPEDELLDPTNATANPRSASYRRTVVIGLVAVIAGAVLVASYRHGSVPLPHRATTGIVAAPPPAAQQKVPTTERIEPVPKTVRVRLVGLSALARVTMDGHVVSENPFSLDRSAAVRHLVIRANGYERREVDIVPLQDLEIPLSLRRSPRRKEAKAAAVPKPAPLKRTLFTPGDL